MLRKMARHPTGASAQPGQQASGKTPETTLSVFLVDDHALYRQCLVELISADLGLRVAGEASSADQALAEAGRRAPLPLADVVLLDVALPGMSGVALAGRLLQLAPASRLLALSMHDDAGVVRAMLTAGAAGYLVKGDPWPEMMHAVRTVAGGGIYLSSALEPQLRARLLARGHGEAGGDGGDGGGCGLLR